MLFSMIEIHLKHNDNLNSNLEGKHVRQLMHILDFQNLFLETRT